MSEIFFSRHDWLFREQPLHDWGIDAHVEPKTGKRPTGQLLALQIKTGPSWFASENSNGVRHNISDWHFDYWLRHQLPVYIILHEPETGLTIWQKVERHLIKKSKKGNWYIRIPRSNVLDENALPAFSAGLAGDPTAFDRNHLALDYPLMCAVRDAHDAYLTVIEMNHKSLSMRGAWFRFKNENKPKPDIVLERWHTRRGIHEYMNWAFPWLEYNHTHPLTDSFGMTEAETHQLKVELNSIGKAFVELEDYFQNGAPMKDYEIIYDDSDEMDEDEYNEWAYQHAMSKD
ncbi:DUF4365 domain-containing protein [Methylobacterium sp. A54F]